MNNINSITVFESNQFGSVRTIGECFVAQDVAAALGYSDTFTMTRRLDEDEKGTQSLRTPGGEQVMTVINESGLYNAIMGSKLPSAKAFKKWVTSEVLPAIRKHGMYATEQTTEQILGDPDFLIATLQAIKAEREARAIAEATIITNAPKVRFADSVSASKGSILVGDMAKLLKQNGIDTGANRFFERLRADGYLISRQGTDYNRPTQRSMELGLFEVKETLIMHANGDSRPEFTSRVSGKGQVYFMQRYGKEIPCQNKS